MTAFSRRRVLSAAVVGAWAPQVYSPALSEREPLPAALLELIDDECSARYLGRRYLYCRGDTCTNRYALAAEIVNRPERDRWIAADVGLRRKLLAERVSSDFAEDRVVTIDGWVLAETEAKLCALAELPHT